MKETTLVGGQIITAHDREMCWGYWCPIHYPSPHHMRDWPQNWRSDRGIMERVCPHGVGHPDPDETKLYNKYDWSHGCDGCCSRAFDLEADVQ